MIEYFSLMIVYLGIPTNDFIRPANDRINSVKIVNFEPGSYTFSHDRVL